MSNLAEKLNSTVAVPADRNAYEQLAAAVAHTPYEGELLKFSKGEYLAPNDEVIEPGTEVVAHLPRLQVGWQKWEDGKPVQHEMGYVAQGYKPPRRVDLGDNDRTAWDLDDQGQPRDPWQKTMYLPLAQRDTGRQFSFTASSKGGIRAIANLSGLYGRRIRDNPNELPIVSLGVGGYRHRNKAYGKILVPEFDIVGWADGSEADDPERGPVSPAPSGNGRSVAPAADTLF